MASSNCGMELLQLGVDADQLAFRLDQADGGAAEIREDGVDVVAGASAGGDAPPGGRRLLQAARREPAVAACPGDQALHPRQRSHERVREVARTDRLERGGADLLLGLVAASARGQRLRAGKARARAADG